ncbi:MAG: outer membrane protein assembly factor BamD [Acidobacteria bacterium]|nr:outer membrane protein assembly factor BamD [Acidobacteriota bacterium]
MKRLAFTVLAAVLVAGSLGSCKSSSQDSLLTNINNMDKTSIYKKAETLYADGDFKKARTYYSFLYDTFPNDPLGHKAALRVADTYYQTKNVESLTEARLRYRDFANRFPNDPDRDYALLMLGNTYTALKLYPDRELTNALEALKAYRQLVTLYPRSPYFDDAQVRINQVQEVLARHEWLVARYYARNKVWKASEARLKYLKEHYPNYSRMDRVNALLQEAKTKEEAVNEEIEKLKKKSKERLKKGEAGQAAGKTAKNGSSQAPSAGEGTTKED